MEKPVRIPAEIAASITCGAKSEVVLTQVNSHIEEIQHLVLCHAVQAKHKELVTLLLESDYPVNYVNKEVTHALPVVIAVNNGYTDLVQVLLDHKADITLEGARSVDTDSSLSQPVISAYQLALEKQDLDILKLIILNFEKRLQQHDDAKTRLQLFPSIDRQTPIPNAAGFGFGTARSREIVAEYSKLGFSVFGGFGFGTGGFGGFGFGPGVNDGDRKEAVKNLQQNPDISIKEATAACHIFCFAVTNDHQELVIDFLRNYGLHMACIAGSYHSLDIMLNSAFCDLNYSSKVRPKTPLVEAVGAGLPFMELLLKNGASVNEQCAKTGETCLHYLCSKLGSILYSDDKGPTPILQILDCLLKAGADQEAKDNHEHTILSICCDQIGTPMELLKIQPLPETYTRLNFEIHRDLVLKYLHMLLSDLADASQVNLPSVLKLSKVILSLGHPQGLGNSGVVLRTFLECLVLFKDILILFMEHINMDTQSEYLLDDFIREVSTFEFCLIDRLTGKCDMFNKDWMHSDLDLESMDNYQCHLSDIVQLYLNHGFKVRNCRILVDTLETNPFLYCNMFKQVLSYCDVTDHRNWLVTLEGRITYEEVTDGSYLRLSKKEMTNIYNQLVHYPRCMKELCRLTVYNLLNRRNADNINKLNLPDGLKKYMLGHL